MDFSKLNYGSYHQSPTKFAPLITDNSPGITYKTLNTNSNLENKAYCSNSCSSSSKMGLQLSNQEEEPFRVFVRVRPLDSKEIPSNFQNIRFNIVETQENMVCLFNPYANTETSCKPEKKHIFNKVFDKDATTKQIYREELYKSIEKVIDGYNSTILAYGMTGAGKTFTMFGDIYKTGEGTDTCPGIITLAVKDLFKAFEQEKEKGFYFTIKFSYLEIYNEHARDLLSSYSDDLTIIEDSQRGIVIPNLSQFEISSHDQIVKLMLQGNSRRVMASTNANQFSSRSHAIIQLTIEKRSENTSNFCFQSKLCLVDLAGSERAGVSENKGLRHREGANINRSLLALGNCINILSDPNKKGAFVPYRDSKLTRLLKESLGGNTQTIMLACISPLYLAYEETVNTLKYASRARQIQRKVMQNVKDVELPVSEYKGIIESLRTEVDILKQKLNKKTNQDLEPVVQVKQTSKQVAHMLDELGKILIITFEENWEIAQSCNELKQLKMQNEALLRTKVQALVSVTGNVDLYNKITEEIASLKEVMSSNQKIEQEMEQRLQQSNMEKISIQNKILTLISQTSQNPENTCFSELTQSSNFLTTGTDTLVQIVNTQEDFYSGRTEKESKIKDLQREVEEMKKKLEEKDKLLMHNQEIIQGFLQTNNNFEPRKNKKILPDCSPLKINQEAPKSLKRQDISLLEKDLEVPVSKVNEIPITVQMMSIAEINSYHYNVLSPNKVIGHKHIVQQPVTAIKFDLDMDLTANYIEEQSSSLISIPQEDANIHIKSLKPNFYDLKQSQSKKNNKISSASAIKQIFEVKPIEAPKREIIKPNKLSFELDDKLQGKKIYQYTSQANSKKCEESNSYRQQCMSHRLVDQTTNTSNIPPNESKSLTKDEFIAQNQIQKELDMLQSSDTSSPNLSTIICSNEASMDASVKEVLWQNLNNIKKTPVKTLQGFNKLNNKENLEKLELETPKAKKTNNLPSSTKNKIKFHKSAEKPNHNESSKKTKHCKISISDLVSVNTLQTSVVRNFLSPTSSAKKPQRSTPVSFSAEKSGVLKSLNKINEEKFKNNLKSAQKETKISRSDIKGGFGFNKKYLYESFSKKKTSELKRMNRNFKTEIMNSDQKPNNKKQPHKSFGELRNKEIEKLQIQDVIQSNEKTRDAKSLEPGRELEKDFRSKLHNLANSVDINLLVDSQMLQIVALINESKSKIKYPLAKEDSKALNKLESVLLNQLKKGNRIISKKSSGWMTGFEITNQSEANPKKCLIELFAESNDSEHHKDMSLSLKKSGFESEIYDSLWDHQKQKGD